MSDTQRCEPPEHLRGVDGWHWVQWPEGPPQLLRWRYVPKMEAHGWTLNTHSTTADGATSAGWRYLAPVTPPCTVAALVEALEAADEFIRNGIEFGYIRMPHPATPDPAHKTPGKIAAALSLYRGETT